MLLLICTGAPACTISGAVVDLKGNKKVSLHCTAYGGSMPAPASFTAVLVCRDVQQVQLEAGQQRIVSLKASLAGVPDAVQQLQYCLDSECSSLSLAARSAGRAAAMA